MSAWLCNEEHIYELAHFYVEQVVATTMSATNVAKILYAANLDSLACRYGDDEEDSPMEVLSHYRPIVTDQMHMAKLIGCFEYQACESNVWEGSEAHEMCQRMLEELNLPDKYWETAAYDAAPWGFSRKEYKRDQAIRKAESDSILARACL